MRSFIWLVSFAALLAASRAGRTQDLQRRHVFNGFEKAFHKPVANVALSADGKTVAAALNDVDTKTWKRWTEFRIWDTASRKLLSSFQRDSDGASVIALSPDGDLLASSTYAGKTLLWSVKLQDERTFVNIKGDTPSLGFSADGKKVAAASRQSILHANAHGGNPEWLPFRGRYGPRAFSPDLRLLACACHQDVDLLDAATGKLQGVLPDHPGSVSNIAFSGDGKSVAVNVSKYDGAEYVSEIVVWDLAKQTVRARLQGLGYCSHLGVNGDGKYLVLITDKSFRAYAHELKTVDVSAGKTTSSIRFERTQTPLCLALSRDGKMVAVGCYDGSVQLFDVK